MQPEANRPPNAPEAWRFPARPDIIAAFEREKKLWSDELFRRYITEEALLPPYRLPDPLLTTGGAPIATAADWERERPNVLEAFRTAVYGAMPPAPDRLRFELLAERADALGGLARRREIRIHCETAGGLSHNFDLLLYVPANATAPPPVFVGLNFKGNQAHTPELDVGKTRAPYYPPGRWYADRPVPDDLRAVDLDIWNFAAAIRRGYAVATAHCGEIFPDNPDGFRSSIFRLFYPPEALEIGVKKPFGAIGAWAWGLSRLLDCLEAQPDVDATRAAVIGHSRLGKTALWAAANDPRFALAISNNSGCGGAAPSRRRFGETVELLHFWRSYWFSDELARYAGREDELPVDQHQLLALAAPRPLYVASATLDLHADPKGEFLAARHAEPVYRLYGRSGLGVEAQPPPDTPVGATVGYHLRTGGHAITAYDWTQYYDFADRHLRRG